MSNQQTNNIKGRNIQIVVILLSVTIALFLGRDYLTECIPEESGLTNDERGLRIHFKGCDRQTILFDKDDFVGTGKYKFWSDLTDIDYFLYDEEGVLSVVYINGNTFKLGRLSQKSYDELRTLREDLVFKRELAVVTEKK